ncbi:hypothetical protein AB0M34_33205 [Nocardia sp. NPDC050193]
MSIGFGKAMCRVVESLKRSTESATGHIANRRYRDGIVRPTMQGVDQAIGVERHGRREIDKASEGLRAPESGQASSRDPHEVDHQYRPVTHHEYSLDEYIRMLERREGRVVGDERRETLRRGCLGVVMDRLGQTHQGVPRMDLAFSDVRSHGEIAELGKVLAPVDAANDNLIHWRKQLIIAEDAMRKHGTRWSFTDGRSGITRSASEHLKWCKENLEAAQRNVNDTLVKASKDHNIKEMMKAGNGAKIEGNKRAFAEVSGYASELRRILATKPADAGEFMLLMEAHPDLRPLHGIERNLPSGKPGDWDVVIVYKDLWSGQSETQGRAIQVGNTDGVKHEGTETPDPTRFAPGPDGRVDMSKDLLQGRPKGMNFNYAYYDEETKSWWGANQGDYDPRNPMRVKQMTDEDLFAARADYDTSVFSIEIVNRST